MNPPSPPAPAPPAPLTPPPAGKGEPGVIGGPADPQAQALQNAPQVELPPSIVASRTYRCADNGLIYVDFFSNDTAAVRTEQDGERHQLASAEGGAYEANGYKVSANAETIQYKSPDHAEQRCRA